MVKYIIGIALIIAFGTGFSIGNVIAEPSDISYKWTDRVRYNCVELSDMLGIEVVGVQYGGIDTGMTRRNFVGARVPILVNGVQIWFTDIPTIEQLEKLDLIFSQQDFKREGGKSLTEKITELENKITILEAKEAR